MNNTATLADETTSPDVEYLWRVIFRLCGALEIPDPAKRADVVGRIKADMRQNQKKDCNNRAD